MRRLYSTFAGGWPGIGLVLMRVVVGAVVIAHAGPSLWSGQPLLFGESVLLVLAALFLVAGLWTPISGGIVGVVAIVEIVTSGGPLVGHLLAATMAAALAMLGPGRYSFDARLFGWKRIEVPGRPSASLQPRQ